MVPLKKTLPCQPSEQKVDQRAMRQRRLEAINSRLQQLGLPLFDKLGNFKEGENELIKIVGEHRFERYWIVEFLTHWADGETRVWAILFNENQKSSRIDEKPILIAGAHCLVTLNRERFVFTRQHRQTLDGWNAMPLEVARGFNPSNVVGLGTPLRRDLHMPYTLDLSDPTMCLPLQVAGRKLAPLLTSGLIKPQKATLMGVTWENSGISRNLVVKTHLDLITDDLEACLKITGTCRMRIQYPLIDEVYENFYSLGLCGEQCTSTLWYFDRMVKRYW